MPAPAAQRSTLAVHLVLLGVQLIFAGFHVTGKVVLETLHPLTLASFRVLFATPVLLLLAFRHDRAVPRLRDLPLLALLGGLGVFANQVLFILGLERTTATNASILMPSIPVFAVAVAGLLRIERPTWLQGAGVAAAVAGALLLLRPGRFALESGVAFGNLLILVNCLSFASYLVLKRPLLERLPWRTVIAWVFLFGSLGVLGVSHRQLAAFDPVAVPWQVWAGVAYILVFPTTLSYSLNTWAVHRSTPSLVAAYTTCQPLFTALLAVPLLGEAIGWVEAVGFVLIASGLGLVSRAAARRAGPAESAAAAEEPIASSEAGDQR